MTSPSSVGFVVDSEPNHLYKVRLENGRLVFAHVRGLASLKIVRLVSGDRVLVQVSDMDPHRGSIVGVGDDQEHGP